MTEGLLGRAAAGWVRYDDYTWEEDGGLFYLMPALDAKPTVFDPLKDAEALVLDALNIGNMCVNRREDEEIRKAMRQFALRYGLLGLMTALPAVPDFTELQEVPFPKNLFFKESSLGTTDYLRVFFPFDEPEDVLSALSFPRKAEDDVAMAAMEQATAELPLAVRMTFQREYAERYVWLKQQFTDWSLALMARVLCYDAPDALDEETRSRYRKGTSAFCGPFPSYRVALLEKPVVLWELSSLLPCIQMLFDRMLINETQPLRLCKHCGKAFVASRPSAVFCSPSCKNRYNVYKSRAKNSGK